MLKIRNQRIWKWNLAAGVAVFLVVFVLISACAETVEKKPEIGAQAEWMAPKKILMHTPGDEVFLGVLHPDAALFEKPFSIKKAGEQHREYIDRLRGYGAAVYTVLDVLLEGTLNEEGDAVPGPELDALRNFAAKSLTIDSSAVSLDMQDEQVSYKEKTISQLSPDELAKIILLRPTVHLYSTETNTGLGATYEMDPVMNLYFLRDQMITTAKGVVISKMHSEQRAPETEIIKFVLNKLGIEPIYEVKGEGRLEGGDYFSAGDTALIGQGLRTNAEGVKQLLDNRVFGVPRVVVVKDSWQNQEEMHLDTYFNIISPKLAVLVDLRMDTPEKPADKDIRTTVDVYQLEEDGYKLKIEDADFQEYMEDELGFTLIPVSRKDQNLYGINFLDVVSNKILAIDGVSAEYKKTLSDAGVDATWMDFSALTSGYGAAHCTTQVLLRKGITTDTEPSQLTDKVFMVSPDDFAYNLETAKSNTFQHQLEDADKVTELAVEQFNNTVNVLETEGIEVIHVPSREDVETPDAVFPNNWFSTHMTENGNNILVIYPMLTPDRRAEVRIDLLEEKLKDQSYDVDEVIDLSYFDEQNKFLEGTGSMVLDRRHHVTFASISPRTDIEVLDEFCRQLNYRSIVFHSYDQNGQLIYHTNVMMSIGDDFAVIAADNIKDDKERTMVLAELRALGKRIIKISPEQVNHMCGNILQLKTKDNNRIIVMSTTAYENFTAEQKTELEKSGKIVPVDIHTIEEVGGGSARCMLGEVF